jgi:hypothetical protein
VTQTQTYARLETGLAQLIDGLLARKEEQFGFLLAVNRLDDILQDLQNGVPVLPRLAEFLDETRTRFPVATLSTPQRRWLAEYYGKLYEQVINHPGDANLRLAEELKDRLKALGQGIFRLTLKAPEEQASLADRFYSLLRRESEELNMLLSEQDHMLTCLDDLLKSAEVRKDIMYRHLAASLIYFLQLEGYKVDPYIKRLRHLPNGV